MRKARRAERRLASERDIGVPAQAIAPNAGSEVASTPLYTDSARILPSGIHTWAVSVRVRPSAPRYGEFSVRAPTPRRSLWSLPIPTSESGPIMPQTSPEMGLIAVLVTEARTRMLRP